MAPTGSNIPAVGEYNRAVVLDAVRRRPGGVTRVEIAEATALNAQTVSNVCKILLERGLIRAVGTRPRGRGKPALLLEIDPDGGYAVGVHIDPSVITYVLVDLSGTVRHRITVDTPPVDDPDEVVASMADSIATVVRRPGIDTDQVLGVGIAAPGPIDVAEGVVLDPPMLPRWHRVPLRNALARATGLPILLEKDVTAATTAELWLRPQQTDRDLLYVYYGTGLATGIATGGHVMRGTSSNAGDSGHIIVDPSGEVCNCGRRGCVGHVAIPSGLVRLAERTGVLDTVPADPGDMIAAFDDLADRAESGDARAHAVLEQGAHWIAQAVVVLVNLLDVRDVVFGGPFWNRISATVLDLLPDAVRRDPALVVHHAITYSSSSAVVDGTAIGAAALVLDGALSPRPDALLIDRD